ncbi:hypothetical protein EDB89DRAFT_551338 [Lactarius sanguifluus]|nr:hypothetical protein EDB89DRAFT_551338 [Lactarius sanguifluus]
MEMAAEEDRIWLRTGRRMQMGSSYLPVYSLLLLHQRSDHCLPAPASSQPASEASLLARVRVRRGHRCPYSTAPRFAQCAPTSTILTYFNHTSSQYTFAVSHLCCSGPHQETIPATKSDGDGMIASPSETEAEDMGRYFHAWDGLEVGVVAVSVLAPVSVTYSPQKRWHSADTSSPCPTAGSVDLYSGQPERIRNGNFRTRVGFACDPATSSRLLVHGIRVSARSTTYTLTGTRKW